MTNTSEPQFDSITVGDGKYTVQLGVSASGRYSFTALRNGEAWRDMSGDGDGLMLAMFHHMLEQQSLIAELRLQKDVSQQQADESADEPGTAPGPGA
jgi:hypothetical protein